MGNLALSGVFTPIGIANYFFAGVPSEQAWNCLVQAHQNYPVLFPLVDLATVNLWYALFQIGALNQLFNPPAQGVPPMFQPPIPAPVQMQSPAMWQMPVQAPADMPVPPNLATWMPSLYSPNAQPQAPILEPAPEVFQMPQSPILAPEQIESPSMWQLPLQAPADAPAPDQMAAGMPMPVSPEARQPAQNFVPALSSSGKTQPRPIPLLHQLPVYHKIIPWLNGHDQRSLIRVCREFKEHIRSQDRLYRKIQLTVRENSILLHVKSGAMKAQTRFIFRRTEDGCSIRTNGRTTDSKKSPLDECLVKLGEYIEKMNARIEQLTVSQTERAEIKPLLQKVAAIMKGLKLKLPIEKFEVETSDFVGFEAVMNEIQPKSLKSLRIRNLNHEIEELNLSNMASLVAHLQNVEVFTVINTRIDIPIEALAHMRTVLVDLLPPTPAQELIYRERLIQFESIVSHILCFPDGFNLQLGADVELDEEDDSFQEIERFLLPKKQVYVVVEKQKSDYQFKKRWT